MKRKARQDEVVRNHFGKSNEEESEDAYLDTERPMVTEQTDEELIMEELRLYR